MPKPGKMKKNFNNKKKIKQIKQTKNPQNLRGFHKQGNRRELTLLWQKEAIEAISQTWGSSVNTSYLNIL